MTEHPTTDEPEVLESEYCSGYMGGDGKWKTGFYCPLSSADGALHCCGTSTHKYCCIQKETFLDKSLFEASLPLLLGIILGITAAVTILMLLSCCFCPCCLLYKKRQVHLNGGQEQQNRRVDDNEGKHCDDPSISYVHVQSELSEVSENKIVSVSQFTLPRLPTVAEEAPKQQPVQYPYIHPFHSFPRKRSDTFSPAIKEDSIAAMIYKGSHLSSTHFTTASDNFFLEKQRISGNLVFDTKEPSTTENLYRSTKF